MKVSRLQQLLTPAFMHFHRYYDLWCCALYIVAGYIIVWSGIHDCNECVPRETMV